jgi:hypothetical protein
VDISVDSRSECTQNTALTKKVHVNKVLQVPSLYDQFQSQYQKGTAKLPSVFVVPVYVEVPSGFERSIATLEATLRRAGYTFHTGEPLAETLEEYKKATDGHIRTERSAEFGGQECLPELRRDNSAG